MHINVKNKLILTHFKLIKLFIAPVSRDTPQTPDN